MEQRQGTQRIARGPSLVLRFLKAFLIFAVAAAFVSYWLYTPLPPGFSRDSSFAAQTVLIGFRLTAMGCRVMSFIGYGSEVELYRSIANDVLKENSRKANVEGVETTDAVFDGVPVRIYRPSSDPQSSEDALLPAIIYFHSGGFVYGSIDTADMITRRLCKDTGAIVVSVEYRLAPEFPYPAAVDDCTAATMHLLLNAADYNADDRRIAVAGDGAGGTLAATVALKLRDEDFPVPLKLQVLVNPATQTLDFDLPSMIEHPNEPPLLTRRMACFFAAIYVDGNDSRAAEFCANRHVTGSVREKMAQTFLNLDRLPKEFLEGYERPRYSPEGGREGRGGEEGRGDDRVWNEVKDRLLDPYISPLAAEDLRNLPETFVLTANHDPLRDEGWLYAVRLKEADNRVTHYNAETGFHGMFSFVGTIPEVEPMFAEITDFIVKRL